MSDKKRPPVCDYEGSDYQTRFWDKGGREYEDRCESIALKRLLPKNGKLLLELGAGAGRNTLRYNGFRAHRSFGLFPFPIETSPGHSLEIPIALFMLQRISTACLSWMDYSMPQP